MSVWKKRVLAAVAIPAALLFTAPAAQASHQWSSYHWPRPDANVLTLEIGDAHTANAYNWSTMLGDVVNDWNWDLNGDGAPDVSFAVVPGSGDINSFNGEYGDSGWLGMASIRVTRGKNKHIVSGDSYINEYYIELPGYTRFGNPAAWQHVFCQEIGHTFGLDHNRNGDIGGTPDNTCMNDAVAVLDYPTPNSHDDEMLTAMYAHDHGGGGGGSDEPKPKKCHPRRGCPSGAVGAAVGHAVWAEHYETDEEMFDAADAVVDVTVLSSNFHRMAGQGQGRGQGVVPVTRVVLRVEGTLSGFTRPVIVLEQTRGPSLEIADDPGYVQGDNYTLYLREIDNNTYRTVNPDGRIRN